MKIFCCAMAVMCGISPVLQRGWAQFPWKWLWSSEDSVWTEQGLAQCGLYLTANNGARSVILREYGNDHKTWITIPVVRDDNTDEVTYAYEYSDWREPAGPVRPRTLASECAHPAAGASAEMKLAFWLERDEDVYKYACTTLSAHVENWDFRGDVGQGTLPYNYEESWHLTAGNHGDGYAYCLFPQEYEDPNEDVYYELNCAVSAGDGRPPWNPSALVRFVNPEEPPLYEYPSLATGHYQSGQADVYVVYRVTVDDGGAGDTIVFRRSTNHGASWDSRYQLSPSGMRVTEPCISSYVTPDGGDRRLVFVCWAEYVPSDQEGVLKYRFSTDNGANWSVAAPVPFGLAGRWDHSSPSVSVVPSSGEGGRHVLVSWMARDLRNGRTYVAHRQAYYGGSWFWQPLWLFSAGAATTEEVQPNPSTDAYGWEERSPDDRQPRACCVWSDPRHLSTSGWGIWRRCGRWGPDYSVLVEPASADNAGRRVRLGLDGGPSHTLQVRPHVVAGPVSLGSPLPVLVEQGMWPALALDGADKRWVAYLRDDTVWCMMGENGVKQVFAGSASARPGQPSIACYPEPVSGLYVGAVVFPTVDSVNEASQILFARVCTSEVVLDTVASRDDLLDSCPCVNVYASDSIFVTFQHGDAVVMSMVEYPANSGSPPPAWSGPVVVAENGYHPMSVLEGPILTTVWSEFIDDEADTFLVRKRARDVSSTVGGWGAAVTVSEQNSTERGNPVYDCGVSAWQEKVSGKWAIRGKVRDSIVTFVSSDTDAYHPHITACSSSTTPSVDQVRVHLLWTQGVVFEVDSAVFDTGVARYKCCSLNVSHAGPFATMDNAGSKLLRKPGSDSLLCVYRDCEANIIYAASSSGDSWQRTSVVSGHDRPAICEDSSGRRWVISYNQNDQRIEARYRASTPSGWSAAQTVYQVPEGRELNGSIALAGSGAGDEGSIACAYCAFRIRNSEGGDNYILVAKFNGSNVGLDTVAAGTEQAQVREPTIAVEKAEAGDYVHVGWNGSDDIRYTMSDGVIDPSDWGENLVWSWETPVNLSGTQDPSGQPCLGASESRLVMVWTEAQDIMARERSTDSAYDNWQDTVRLISAQTESRYPTVSVSDSVVITWEEHLTENDWDIIACVEYADTFTVRNTSTESSYPHVLFQNKPSGDTAIPYVHCIWSEEPQEDYFEVAYEKLNLKQQSGGGQQTGGVTELLQPRLYSCAPNPFTRSTSIRFQFGQAGNVALRIYDASGRLVTTLKQGQEKPGVYQATWRGTDQKGREVPNGIYFYRLDAPGIGEVKKAVLMR